MPLATIGAEILERASRIRLIVLDADGVLTDGRIILSSDGTEARAFDVTDGFGIRLGARAGLLFAIVSGRRSEVLARRAADLRIEEVHQGILDKAGCLREILGRRSLSPAEACFVGDDLIDLPPMRLAGLAAAPASARDEVREAAHFVAGRAGGHGAVREVVELVLRATGRWDAALRDFLGPDGG
jgi:3-deoxy-D-manno-octulosonate 8-phosphate phosphatase (KDO 8-P phosphatase)